MSHLDPPSCSPSPPTTLKDPTPITDPRNAPTLSVPQNKYTTYDFSPFLHAPAVQDRILANRQQIPLVSQIPQTRIPSPLAENLHPSVIKDLHDYMLGRGKYASPSTRKFEGDSGDGQEVWAAWKRAWDIWNNHYMEGRVNEVWVSRVYKQWEAYIAQQAKKGKKPFEGPGARRPLRRKKTRIGKAYRTESKALEQLEASIDEIAQGREGFKKRAMEDLKARFRLNRHLGNGYVEFSEQLEEWQRRNWYQPKWKDYEDYKNKSPEYLPLTMDDVYDELHGDVQERVKELLHVDFWKKDPKLESRLGTIEYAIALARWEQLPEVRRCRLTVRPSWRVMRPVERLEEKYIESAMKRTSPAVIDEFRELMETNRKMGIGYIEYSWQLAHYNINMQAHKGEIDPAIQELEKPDPADYIDKAHPGKADEGTEPVTAIDREEEDDDQDEDDIDPNHLTRPLPVEDNGSSGGFFAMKDFAEYAVPDEDDESFEEYYDPIENSVWRPIQVGEREVRIAMDEDPDTFLKNSQFEIDGGVDCGRSPYPLLRPLYRYAQSQIELKNVAQLPAGSWDNDPFQNKGSLLKLKKTWDKVTGTIFNIPTRSIDQQTLNKAEDRDHRESFQDHSNYQNPDIFPFNIRRCEEVRTPHERDKSTRKTPALIDDDHIIQPSLKMQEKHYRAMRCDDPWWVDVQQKRYRDMPPRNYPPRFDESQSYLPKDDKLWKDEVKKDSDLNCRYFAANLDGRLLRINGIEVGKGEIAGPLPEFAIITTEGGGVTFWFGVGGRFYLQPAGARTKDWSRQWAQLRLSLNEKYFGVTAGYFWQNAIVSKILEDDEGEGEQDPKWIGWKNARPARITGAIDSRDNNLQPHQRFLDYAARSDEREDWGAPGPLPFESPEAELKWVAAQLHFQKVFANEPWLKAKMIEPTWDTAWGGLEDSYRHAADGPTDTARDEWWSENRRDYKNAQKLSGQAFKELQREQADADQAADEASSLKRKAEHDGYFPPNAKRFRENIEEREREKIQQIERRAEKQLDKGLQELVHQINEGAQEIAEEGLEWHPASGAVAEEQARQALQRVRELERLRVLLNERRKGAKEITIPPMKDPIAGLVPSTILTRPENRWALEAIVKNREHHRLEQEVQETAALNNQNASDRLKRKRIAERRKRGALGFTAMTDAEQKAQKVELEIKAKEEKEAKEVKSLNQAMEGLNSKKKQVKKDKENAKSMKEGIKDGDVVKAQAAAKKSEQELSGMHSKLASNLALTSWAAANNVTEDQILKYMQITDKPFDAAACSAWVNRAADVNRKREIKEAAATAAYGMGLTVVQWCQQVHGVADVNAYIRELYQEKTKKAEYALLEDAKKAKRQYLEALLRAAIGPNNTREGDFHSWDDAISSMPVANDWDGLINSGQGDDPTTFSLVPRKREVNAYDGTIKWAGFL
ncbi:hypothetical protein DSL72_005913 [Monilinia vaccinii-corymbosi]|uniref:Uncharacterized protein n=1 Tax=Monilinia vaccinii-corymbosi TaxID=61207 RepID=A0A8A3PGD0_9HELO|nr:hypothetical protein DSL72_005913 [Monilinia vaccinii-corymbosi]